MNASCQSTTRTAATPIDAKAEREAAAKAEQAGDWDAALLHYENVYDSTPCTPEEYVQLRRKFEELRPKDWHGRLGLFLEIAAEQGAREIPDPFDQGPAAFERMLDLVEKGSRLLVKRVGATLASTS